ncbi:3'-5' exonuclease [Tepidibacillus fermentans]|uniref:Inhibitor of KinA sporulation pathway (Predicted exonuclease) n=1 Tax=Tepidibacillus fermentans TaxID=1281767 RepID=A0A4R3KD81_9BACI|nr:3'-5' exonuclease [Tepidibacillus fermentans]TCS81045.1 inhibitor of KinA sporulation pathway (predicted exonuclease) [Tepidibacillus fermentans]
MNYIVFDLEFTVTKKQYMTEIIEIGAVKIRDDEGRLEVVDLFQSFVRPQRHTTISSKTKEFTGITLDDINRAPTFPEIISEFLSWIGDDEYYLIAWGQDDKYQMLKHCKHYNLSYDWIKNYNDFQWLITKRTSGGKHQRIGLAKAMELFEIPFEGRPHRGIDDAYNTAKLFMTLFPTLILEKNGVEEDYLYTSQLVYQSGEDAGYHPFANLQTLLQDIG